jgi:exodeoxyribonuclease VII small subunit
MNKKSDRGSPSDAPAKTPSLFSGDEAPSASLVTTEELSFEQSIERLSDIVEELEGGDLPLEESLRLFEEGVKLARTSQAKLDRAEKRVEELLGVDDAGKVVTRELDSE